MTVRRLSRPQATKITQEMMVLMKNITLILTLLLLCSSLAACTARADIDTSPTTLESYSSASSTTALTVTEGGSYRLAGDYDGMIVVDVGAAEVELILDGARISADGKAAVNIRSADRVTLTLADGSENSLVGKRGIYSASPLVLCGDGSLDITATDSHGISAKSDLTVASGSYTIASKKDGIHVSSDTSEVSFLALGGTFDITSDGDGISSSGAMCIDDGTFNIVSGGGIANAVEHTEDFGGHGFFGGLASGVSGFLDGVSSAVTEGSLQTSFKSVKADGDITINGGTFTLESAEDTIHSDSSITVNGGSYTLTSGDDAIHADLSLVINDCTLCVTTSYEGIEAKTIDVNGGTLDIRSSDDGFNASGGTSLGFDPMAAEEGVYLRFCGGVILVDADGDGVDSNGELIVDGGELYVAGPSDGANGAIDYGSEATINGGIVIAVGDSGMAETFGSGSTQGSIMVDTGMQSGGTVTLADEDGNVILSRTFDKTFSNVVISCPEITDGATFTLTAGDYTEVITMDGLQYGSGGGMHGGFFGNIFGGGKKDRGDMGDRGDHSERGDMPEMPELPEGNVPPEMPEGDMPPEMPEGGMPPDMPEGDMPELPEGDMPPDMP